jgi:histidyl-tRNA synthetase
VAVESSDHRDALDIARDLRASAVDGLVVEQDVRLRGVKSALRYADRAGIDLVVIVGERERAENAAVVRDMRTRAEKRVTRAELRDTVRGALG